MVTRSRIVRIVAPNPSPMTLDGTNSYLIVAGTRALAIDPGPAIPEHQAALVAAVAIAGAQLEAILVTHGHPDHAPGAVPLAALTGAPVYAHPSARFPHDRVMRDGDRVPVDGLELVAIDAPGHADDHLVFACADEAALFTGDVVVGRGTVVVAPPRGDMRAYQRTLTRLRDEFPATRTLYGGHGEPVATPRAKLDEYLAHRATRERQLLAALDGRERTIPDLVAEIYAGVAALLWPAAARQLLAYLVALEREGQVCARTLDRALTTAERAVLDPDLSALADPAGAAVARAELGFERNVRHVEAYRLAREEPV